ncbi:MAG: diaminopimelate epimerase [Bacteroidales bacterium]
MIVKFFKYHGAGNDFIIIDERQQDILSHITENHTIISALCHRRFGIGADGLMILRSHHEYDFHMFYYNSDGYEGSMCGNGGRCLTAFASHQGIIENKTVFLASDGLHKATINSDDGHFSSVSLSMNDVTNIRETDYGLFLDTGSPHIVKFTEDLLQIKVESEGKNIRNADTFRPLGTNVNFVAIVDDNLHIRTYERGVENETLACGTGITAAAIAAFHKGFISKNNIEVIARGGLLNVSFSPGPQGYRDIILTGPAQKVFEGEIQLSNLMIQ